MAAAAELEKSPERYHDGGLTRTRRLNLDVTSRTRDVRIRVRLRVIVVLLCRPLAQGQKVGRAPKDSDDTQAATESE